MNKEMKPWYASLTIWVNVVSFVAALAVFLLDQPLIQQNPQVVAVIGAVLAFANILLRFKTILPIETQGRREELL